MTTEDALRACIALHPLDTTPRLIYADWLDEDGRPEEARDQRLHAAMQRICEDPASDAARLEWCKVAESVPAPRERDLVDVGRTRYLLEVSTDVGGKSWPSPDDYDEWDALRAREAALARTVGLHRRSEFVRVQMELAKMKCAAVDDNAAQREWCVSLYERGVNKRIVCGPCHKIHELRERERELLKENVYEWTPRLLDRCQLAMESDCAVVLYTTMPPQSVRVQFSRGFIDSITCDWSTWVQHGHRCAWRPGWTEVCKAKGSHHDDECSGGRIQSPDAQFTRQCPTCHGTGRTPRAFTGSEQPVTKLRLTDRPTVVEYIQLANRHKMPMFSEDVEELDRRIGYVIAAEWPGLEVTLPAANSTPIADMDLSALTMQAARPCQWRVSPR